MAWGLSHKWNMDCHTAYEIRREMRVRESRHTVMLFDQRYYDIDNCKYVTDKLRSIPCESLGDIIDSDSGYDPLHRYKRPEQLTRSDERFYANKLNGNVYNFPANPRKKDDFDDQDQEAARLKAVQARRVETERRKAEHAAKETEYQARVKAREAELESERARGYYGTTEHTRLQCIGFIRKTNSWIPK